MQNIKSIAAGLYLGCAAIGLTTIPAYDAQAALMAEDLLDVAGPDNFITRDTATNLDWLDVDITVSTAFVSINQSGTTFAVLGGKNPITDFGFRHATSAEVSTFFSNAMIPVITGDFTPSNFAPVEALMTLIGPTGAIASVQEFAQAFVSDGPSAGAHFMPFIQRCVGSVLINLCSLPGAGVNDLGQANPTNGDLPSFFAVNTAGHWLVRDTPTPSIPEPASVLILGFGLAGLGFARRRKAA